MAKTSINVEEGYKRSYMDKNLFMLGLERLIDSGFKFLMGEFKKGLDSRDPWKLRTTACSLKEIADYHGAPILATYCSAIKQHSDKGEIDHIYPIYAQMAREVFIVRRHLIKYLKEQKDPQYKEKTKEEEIPLAAGFKVTFKPSEVLVIDVKNREVAMSVDGQKKSINCCITF